jgi:hypothetical protein
MKKTNPIFFLRRLKTDHTSPWDYEFILENGAAANSLFLTSAPWVEQRRKKGNVEALGRSPRQRTRTIVSCTRSSCGDPKEGGAP